MKPIQCSSILRLAVCLVLSSPSLKAAYTSQVVSTGAESTFPYNMTGLIHATEAESTGSGVVARYPKVVISCAHVVYDENHDVYEDGWKGMNYFHRAWNSGEFPSSDGQLLRSYWHFGSYSGGTSDQAFSLDFVAHYAYENTANGGYAGWFPNGGSVLQSSRSKMITGYPAGLYPSYDYRKYRMHATGPFTLAYSATSYSTYVQVNEVSTGPGNSGGPVWAYDSGGWNFAGVLVSGLERSRGDSMDTSGVRVMDQSAWNLVDSAYTAAGGTVPKAPQILSHPSNARAYWGENATFTASASGTPTPSLRWQVNKGSGWADISDGTAYSGTASGTLVVYNVNSAHSNYSFRLKAFSSGGTVYSTAATISVLYRAPSITAQPQSKSFPVGVKPTFSVTATGSPPLRYQWKWNGENLNGATNSTLVLVPAQLVWSGGKLTVLVSNSAGSVLSAAATLTVYACSYSLATGSTTFSSLGGNGSVAVTATGSCSWNVINAPTWIRITSATNQTGSGHVYFSVTTNNSTLPRTGALTIAGKTFIVAQGPQFSPANIRGKTLVMSIGSAAGTLPSSGKYLVTIRSSTNNYLQIVPVSGATTATGAPYTSVRSNATVTSFTYNSITTTLNFTNLTGGKYMTRKGTSWQSGTFVLANKTPDLDGDGRTDIAWQNSSTRVLSGWLMSGTNQLRNVTINSAKPPPAGWKSIGVADFNNDGQSDILFQTSTSGLNLWLMSRTNVVRMIPLRAGVVPGTNRVAMGTADLNGDNQPDVLFQDREGRLSSWMFNGTNYVTSLNLRASQPAAAGYRVAAIADFTGDRQADILFQHTSGTIALWLMNGTSFVTSAGFSSVPTIASTWRIAGAGDFNLDGRNDILWQNSDGKLMAWLMNGRTYTGTVLLRRGQALSAGLKMAAPK